MKPDKSTNNPAWVTAPFEMFLMTSDDARAERTIAAYRKRYKVKVRREDGWIFASITDRTRRVRRKEPVPRTLINGFEFPRRFSD